MTTRAGEIKNGCVWELRALCLNPNTAAKVLLPDISEINPPQTDESDYTVRQSSVLLSCVKTWATARPWVVLKDGGWETEAQSLHQKERDVCRLFCLAKTSPPLHSTSSPWVATGRADSGGEILWHFPRLLQPLSPRCREGCWVLYQGAPERGW